MGTRALTGELDRLAEAVFDDLSVTILQVGGFHIRRRKSAELERVLLQVAFALALCPRIGTGGAPLSERPTRDAKFGPKSLARHVSLSWPSLGSQGSCAHWQAPWSLLTLRLAPPPEVDITAPRHKTPEHWLGGRAGRPSRRRAAPPGLLVFPGVGPTRRDAPSACRRRLRSPTRP